MISISVISSILIGIYILKGTLFGKNVVIPLSSLNCYLQSKLSPKRGSNSHGQDKVKMFTANSVFYNFNLNFIETCVV